jgi:methylated-DNA-protein-cysteine methyltransferase related protein
MTKKNIPAKKKKPAAKKKKDFFDRVYEIVAKIPYGKVATFGDIAEACGIRSSARTVGWALNGAKDSGLPCHRVVNRFGALTGRMHFGSFEMMQDLLLSEGIKFDKDGCVILEDYLWDPQPVKKRKTKLIKVKPKV